MEWEVVKWTPGVREGHERLDGTSGSLVTDDPMHKGAETLGSIVAGKCSDSKQYAVCICAINDQEEGTYMK